MKKLWPMIVLAFFILIGVSFLIFVIQMIWFPPSTMGMMMGPQMMFHHMSFWFGQLFWISLIILGILLLVLLFFNKRKK